MFLKDNTNKCTITDNVLFNNLQPYSLIDFNNNLYIDYNINSEYNSELKPSPNAKQITIKFNLIENLIRLCGYDSVFNEDSPLHDVWLPLFVDKDSSNIQNKLLSRGTSIEKTQLGIENFLSFVPKFKNWTVEGSEAPMTTDWILNSPFAGYNAQYGILCWIKYSKESAASSLKSTTFKMLEAFPIGSRLRTNIAGKDSHFIKIDNDKLLILNKDDSTITGTSIEFNIGSNVTSPSEIGNDAKFCLVRPDSDKFYGTKHSVELWIPDGDFYTYLEDEELNYDGKKSSRTYLSPALYNKYIQIYHILTMGEIKFLDQPKLIRKSRTLKRICYALATSPLSDSVCHNYLNNSTSLARVDNYLRSVEADNFLYDNIAQEKLLLRDFLTGLFSDLKNFKSGLEVFNEKLNKKTLNNNYIVSKRELFQKLTSKYATNLTIANNLCSISYNKLLSHGDHLLINQSISSYCPVNTPVETVVYNNQTIQLNNIIISTNIDNVKSEINLNNTKILPLTDIIKETSKDLKFSIGPDQIYKYDNGEAVIEIEGIIDGDFTGLQGYAGKESYTWEQISGPCLRFSDYYRDSFKQVKFTYSTEYKPILYIYGPGTYVIKCTIITDIGTVSSSKTIYVFDKAYAGPLPDIKPAILSKLETGGLKVICPNLNTVAIHKRGMFWPIKTDLFIGKYNEIYDDQFTRLQGQEKFVFRINKNKISHKDSALKLIYNPNNTTIKINRYILQNMRDETEECSQCKSFYKDLVVSDKSSYYHRQRNPDSITLPRYIFRNNKAIKLTDITFDYPEISTKYTAPIKTYGGHSDKDDYFMKIEIPYSKQDSVTPIITGHNLVHPNRICFETNENDYLIGTYNDNTMVGEKCSFVPNSGAITKTYSLEQDNPLISTTYIYNPNNTSIDYENPYINKSSILKFNPGARTNFTFKGAGFKNLSCSYSGNYIIPNSYKSSVILNIDPRIVPEVPKDGATPKEIEETKVRNQKKELKDHDVNHGYRYLNDGIVNIENDEYGYVNSSLIRSNSNCDGSEITYSFSSLGPKKLEPGKLQDIVVPNFSIQDLSVKLNFLNYVNTKNLIVWLDVDVCLAEAEAINGPPPKCQLKNGISPDQYCGFSYEDSFRLLYSDDRFVTYLGAIGQMNYNKNNRTQIRLYLLNQEHIQNNTYNFSVEFTDDAPKINKAHDFHTRYGDGGESIKNFIYEQNIISNNDKLLPTTMAPGYADYDHITYANILNNINTNTSSWFYNNTFKKFKNFSLFKGVNGAEGATKFTLNIAVIDESDQMRIFDNINDNNLFTGFNSSINKQQSSEIYNSLCSWELCVNTSNKIPLTKENTGPLGLIEYDKEPSYPGYTFVSRFDDGSEANNQKYLPIVNTNSPFTFLNNSNLCRFQDYESLQSLFSDKIEFPIAAILAILGAADLAILLMLGGLGSGAAAAGMFSQLTDAAYKTISNYFSDRRRQQTLEEINQIFDRADYTSYPFGSPEKILLSVAKPISTDFEYKNNYGLPLWYKMEASIFKLENLPILEKNKYKFIKLDKNTLPEFSRFKFETVNSFEDIIDREFLEKFVTVTVLDGQLLTGRDIISGEMVTEPVFIERRGKGPINGVELKDDDIIKVINNNGRIDLYTIKSSIIPGADASWEILPYNYGRNRKLSQYFKWGKSFEVNTSSLAVGQEATLSQLTNLILSKQLISVEGKLPFDLFNNLHDSQNLLEFYSDPSGDSKDIKIINIILMIKNGKFYTLIHLSEPVVDKNNIVFEYFSPKQNCLLVFKNDNTTINEIDKNNNKIPMDKWGLQKKQSVKQCPTNPIVARGVGSYGDGNPYVDKNILTYNAEDVILPSISDQFNNENKLNYSNYEITYSDNMNVTQKLNFNTLISITNSSLNEKSDIFVNNQNYLDSNISDDLKKELFNSIVDINLHEKNYFYLYAYDDIRGVPNSGEISFNNDLINKNIPLYEIKSDTYERINNRLKTLNSESNVDVSIIGQITSTDFIIKNGSIKDLENHYNALPEDDEKCYNSKQANCYKKNTKNILNIRYLEKNDILSYLELRKKSLILTSPSDTIYPQKLVDYIQDNNNTININIKDDKAAYIINIDPKQECSLDTDLTFKILKKIEYQCVPLLGLIVDLDAANICAQFTRDFTTKDNTIKFTNKGDTYEYVFNIDEIKKELGPIGKDEYWKEFIVEREFFINANGPRDTLVKVKEYYDIINDKHPIFTQNNKNDGSSISNRVYNICNLDDVSTINFQPKIIPRKLKGVDKHYDKYFPNKDGALVKSVNPSAGGPVNSSLRFWRCLDSENKELAETTPYLKVQNEMIYRAFFNSVDGIEHKINMMESLYPWEWIPYEYDF